LAFCGLDSSVCDSYIKLNIGGRKGEGGGHYYYTYISTEKESKNPPNIDQGESRLG